MIGQRLKVVRLLLLSALFLFPSLVRGAVLYVSTATGNDANDGLSVGNAKSSLASAYTAASSGDTLRIASGTYLENMEAIAKSLTFEGGYRTDFASRDTALYTSTVAGRLYVNTGGISVTFDGLSVTSGAASPIYLNWTGSIASSVTVRNCFVFGSSAPAVDNYASSHISLTVAHSTLTRCQAGVALGPATDGLAHIYNNLISSMSLFGGDASSVKAGRGVGIQASYRSVLIASNTIEDCAIFGVDGSGAVSGTTVRGNRIQRCGSGGSGGFNNGGIRYSANVVRIENNIIDRCSYTGISLQSSNVGSVIKNNTILNMNGEAILDGSGAVFKNNILINNYYAFNGTNKTQSEIAYNILANNVIEHMLDALYDFTEPGFSFFLPNMHDNIVLPAASTSTLFVDGANGDYRLAPDSIAIDLGDPSETFALEPAPNGGRADSGAYGGTPLAAVSESSAPAAVTDLTALPGDNQGEVRLFWSTPGDDGTRNRHVYGALYILKYSTFGLSGYTTQQWWTDAAQYSPQTAWVVGESTAVTRSVNVGNLTAQPMGIVGHPERRVVNGLTPGVTYYFMLKTQDNSGNLSEPDVRSTATATMAAAVAQNAGNSVPILGHTVDYVLGQATQTLDGSNLVTVKFRVKDADGPGDIIRISTWGDTYYTYAAQYWSSTGTYINIRYDHMFLSSGAMVPAANYSGTEFTLTWYTTATATNLEISSASIRFKVKDPSGTESLYASTGPFSIDNRTPSAVAAQILETAPTSVRVGWGESSEVNFSQYKIWFATYSFNQGTFTSANYHWTASSDTALYVRATTYTTVTGLSVNTTYWFYTQVLDQFGHGSSAGYAVPSTMTLTDSGIPGSVSDLTALPSTGNSGEIRLEWTAPGNDGTSGSVTSGRYAIRYTSMAIITEANFDSPPSPYFEKIIATSTVAGQKNGVLLTGLSAGTSYWFAIKLRDSALLWGLWRSSQDVSTVNTLAYGAANLSGNTPPLGTFSGDFSLSGGASYDGTGTDEAYGVAVDSLSVGGPYIYTVGRTSMTASITWFAPDNYFIVKYDSNGNKLISRTFDGAKGRSDQANAVALDPSGNVYVTGTGQHSAFAYSFLTLKYDAQLDQQAFAEFRSTQGVNDQANAIALDPSGNVIVAGYKQVASGSGDSDIVVLKYNSGLSAVLASATVVNPGAASDEAYGVVTDGSGNVYLCGQYSRGGQYDFFVAKFNSSLVFVSSALVNGLGNSNDQAYAIARDASGNLFATGHTWTGTSDDILTIKFDSNLNVISSATFNGAGDGVDYGYAVAVDSNGYVVVAGRARVGATDDYIAIRYNNSLSTVISSASYDGGASDVARGVALGLSTAVYVAGYSNNGSNSDFRTILRGLASAAPDAGAPSPISNLTALTGSLDGTVQLYWTVPQDNTGVSKYQLRASTNPMLSAASVAAASHSPMYSFVLDFSSSPSPSAGVLVGRLVTGLNPGTTYYFGVRAGDDANNFSTWSVTGLVNSLSSAPAADLPLSAPSGISALLSDVSSTSIAVRWIAPAAPSTVDDRGRYRLYAATADFTSVSDSWVTLSSEVAHPLSSAATAQLQPNTTYFFRVSALDHGDQGAGLFSVALESASFLSYSTVTLAVLPVAQSVGPADLSSSSATFRWSGSSNPAGTRYEAAVSSSSDFTAATSSETLLVSISTSGLVGNASYYFRVRTLGHGGGAGGWSNTVGTVTLAAPPSVAAFVVHSSSISAILASEGNGPGTRIRISTQSDFSASASSEAVVSSSNAFTLTLSGLAANSTYTVRAAALNSAGLLSSSVVVASTYTPAAAPSGVSFIGVSGTSVTAGWSANGNPLTPPTSYQMLVSTSPDFATGTSSETFLLQASSAQLSANTTYYFKVAAFDRFGGTTAFSAALSTVTGPLSPGYSGFEVFTTSITVDLTSNGNAPGTTFQVSTGAFEASTSSSGASVAGITRLILLNLAPNSGFTIQARSVGGSNTASSATVVAVSTWTLAAVPGDFAAFAPQDVGASSATARWGANGNPLTPPTSYHVQISTVSDFASGLVTSSETFLLSVATSGLSASTTYYFRARAFNVAGGTSPYNAAASTVTRPASPGYSGYAVYADSVTVQLSANGNGAGASYRVDISSDGFASVAFSSQGASSGGNAPSLSLSGLQPNTTYQIGATALLEAGGESSRLIVASTATLPKSPGAFAAIALSDVGTSTISVSWSANGNPLTPPTSYQLQISTDSGFAVYSASDTFLLSASSAALQPNASYYFRVRAHGRTGYQSAFNSAASTATLAAAPSLTAFNAALVGVSSVSVLWTDANPSPTDYQVQFSSSSDFAAVTTSASVANVPISTQSLASNTTVYARVRAVNRWGLASSYSSSLGTATLSVSPAIESFTMHESSASVLVARGANASGTTFIVRISSVGLQSSAHVGVSGIFSAAASSEIIVTGLAPNTSHQVEAAALNFSQLPSSFTSLAASTHTRAAMPGTLSFAGVTAGSVSVQWGANGNPLTPPTSYQMQASLDSNFSGYSSSETFLLSASTSGLSPNTTYYFRAAASGRNAFMSAFAPAISTVTPPLAPGIASFAVHRTSVAVTLASNGNPAGTYLSVTTGSFETSASSRGALAGTALTLVLQNLTANRAYSFQARAESVTLNSSSATAIASTATLPGAPATITFTAVTNNQISASWDSGGNSLSPPTSYQIHVASGDSNFASFTASTTFLTSVTTQSLAALTTYYFRVFAFGVGGSSSAFSAAFSTVTADAPLTAPSAPSALTVSAVSTGSITLGWTDASSNESGFLIVNATGGVYQSAGINETSAVIGGLSPDELVAARVAAYNSAGASTSAAAISSYTLAHPPSAPQFISVGRAQAQIAWSANGNPSSVIYEISQSTDNFTLSFSTPLAFSGAQTASTATVGGLSPGGTYYFRVRAQNRGGAGTAFSSVITTVTAAADLVVSTGGMLNAGLTTLTVDPGVMVYTDVLANGTTQQTLVSTQSATASYGNGITLTLTSGVEARVVASADGLTLASTRTVPLALAGCSAELSSGTIEISDRGGQISLDLSSSSTQDLNVSFTPSGDKNISIGLNPASGRIGVLLPPGALGPGVRARFKLPSALPSGAPSNLQIPSQSRFTASSLSPVPAPALAPASSHGTGVGLEILVDGSAQPSKPVPISMSFRPADVSGLDRRTLAIARYHETDQRWVPLPSNVSPAANFVSAVTDHFSRFQLMAVAPASTVEQARAYPNPLRLHRGQTEMTFVNLSAGASIKIFTYAGERVREVTADASGIARWDAKNDEGLVAASGVYVVLIEGSGSKKTMKIAVEK